MSLCRRCQLTVDCSNNSNITGVVWGEQCDRCGYIGGDATTRKATQQDCMKCKEPPNCSTYPHRCNIENNEVMIPRRQFKNGNKK